MNRAFTPWAVILGALALAGCHSVAARIRERPAAFAALDPVRQREIRLGLARRGDTEDVVYLALGRPSAIQDYPDDPTVPGSRSGPVRIWYYFTLAAGNPRFAPAPGSEGVPEIDPVPDATLGYRQTTALVVFQHGTAIRVRYYR